MVCLGRESKRRLVGTVLVRDKGGIVAGGELCCSPTVGFFSFSELLRVQPGTPSVLSGHLGGGREGEDVKVKAADAGLRLRPQKKS